MSANQAVTTPAYTMAEVRQPSLLNSGLPSRAYLAQKTQRAWLTLALSCRMVIFGKHLGNVLVETFLKTEIF